MILRFATCNITLQTTDVSYAVKLQYFKQGDSYTKWPNIKDGLGRLFWFHLQKNKFCVIFEGIHMITSNILDMTKV